MRTQRAQRRRPGAPAGLGPGARVSAPCSCPPRSPPARAPALPPPPRAARRPACSPGLLRRSCWPLPLLAYGVTMERRRQARQPDPLEVAPPMSPQAGLRLAGMRTRTTRDTMASRKPSRPAPKRGTCCPRPCTRTTRGHPSRPGNRPADPRPSRHRLHGARPARAGRAARGRITHAGRERALGYTTFPERKRAVSPEGSYQARRIRAACEARGMVLHQLVGDVESYSGPDLERPGLTHALDMLAQRRGELPGRGRPRPAQHARPPTSGR